LPRTRLARHPRVVGPAAPPRATAPVPQPTAPPPPLPSAPTPHAPAASPAASQRNTPDCPRASAPASAAFAPPGTPLQCRLAADHPAECPADTIDGRSGTGACDSHRHRLHADGDHTEQPLAAATHRATAGTRPDPIVHDGGLRAAASPPPPRPRAQLSSPSASDPPGLFSQADPGQFSQALKAARDPGRPHTARRGVLGRDQCAWQHQVQVGWGRLEGAATRPRTQARDPGPKGILPLPRDADGIELRATTKTSESPAANEWLGLLTSDRSFLYGVRSASTGTQTEIRRVPLGGGPPITTASHPGSFSAFAVGANSLYWAVAGQIFSLSIQDALSSAGARRFAAPSGEIQYLLVDDTHLYWTSATEPAATGAGTIGRCSHSCPGSFDVLAQTPGRPRSLAQDATAIYWVTENGFVQKLAIP
jgi:hypothetical protein